MKEVGGRGVVFVLCGLVGGLLGALAAAPLAWAGAGADDPLIGPDWPGFVALLCLIGGVIGAGLGVCVAWFALTLPSGRRVLLLCVAVGAVAGAGLVVFGVARAALSLGWSEDLRRFLLNCGGASAFVGACFGLAFGAFHAADVERQAARAAGLPGPPREQARPGNDGIEGADV